MNKMLKVIRAGLMQELAFLAFMSLLVLTAPASGAVNAPVAGEIQFITVDNPDDHWSGGTIVVGGQVVILPRNLLLDLPANRLTLQELYTEAPDACKVVKQTGLAKADSCNSSGMGGYATIHANRTSGGNVIAGDVFIEKGVEAVTGPISYIDYNDGYFRVNGIPGDPATGVMVRLNDPDGRHTVQKGLGCSGGPNCSPDPRFTLDPDNYVNVFTTGFPLCIPSTTPRTFDGSAIGLPANAVAQAAANGTGDLLCPTTNRTVNNGEPVDDSRRFAPIMLGDSISAEGNFERINGVQFLSAHTTMVFKALSTKLDANQPDYLFLDEVELDSPAFQNQRIRTLIIGYTTVSPSDVNFWTIHYDPQTNTPHEFPLASVQGCDNADGIGSCSQQGLVGAGAQIFRVRHDVDFLAGAKPRLNPCAHLRADPRFAPLNICPVGGSATTNLTEMMGILSPLPREIQARTGRSLANPNLVTLDVNGNRATNGQYLFPFGMGLGGIAFMEFNEIDLNALQTPYSFTGMPWTLDRRLSPGGCFGPCETTPQPLDPYPYEGIDPRTQASSPVGLYTDTNFSAQFLTGVRDRMLSFVDGTLTRTAGNGHVTPASGNFNGNATVLQWPPVDPAPIAIPVTPIVRPNHPPIANADTGVTVAGVSIIIGVLANDSDPDGNTLTVTSVTPGTGGTPTNNGTNVTFAPAPGFVGQATFSYTIADGQGGNATAPVTVTVSPARNTPPVANPDSASTAANTAVTVQVLANDTDADGDPLRVVSVTSGARGTVTNNGLNVTYTPNAGTSGTDLFSSTVGDGRGGVATANVTVNVAAQETLTTAIRTFITSTSEWRVAGTSTAIGATVTVRAGNTLAGPVIGTAVVGANRVFQLRVVNSPVQPDATRTISLSSTGGGQLLGLPVTVQ